MLHVINSRELTKENPCISKAIHALLMHGYATFNIIVPGHRFAAVTRCVLPGPRTSIIRGNYVRETSVKRRNEIVKKTKQKKKTKKKKKHTHTHKTQNVANVFQFLCNNCDRTWFFNALTFARSLGRY